MSVVSPYRRTSPSDAPSLPPDGGGTLNAYLVTESCTKTGVHVLLAEAVLVRGSSA